MKYQKGNKKEWIVEEAWASLNEAPWSELYYSIQNLKKSENKSKRITTLKIRMLRKTSDYTESLVIADILANEVEESVN